ncbi:MAG: DUF3179 domain-containing protein [Bacteroidetes bacterium]|nr:MAG: DUF3179 domain-containing protein [Bacteroidota bacterium]
MHIKTGLIILFAGLLFSCNKDNNDSPWALPVSQIFDGGPGKDGIPAVDNPQFIPNDQIEYMDDSDLIVGVKFGDQIRGYTHPVMDWHEIVNDGFGGKDIALTYCPLTGTAIGWDRNINGQVTQFGVSGLLYNTNLIPYDRKTDSNWSQMKLECVNGPLLGTKINTFHTIETTWATWKTRFPNATVLSTNTGFNRPYGTYPYISPSGADYRKSNSYLLFPVEPRDDRLPAKERVLGIIENAAVKAFSFEHFQDGVQVVEDEVGGTPVVVVGSRSENWLTAFKSTLPDGTTLHFTAISGDPAAVLLDDEGSKWNIWGEAIEGLRAGQKLPDVISFMGYWIAWGAFYPDIEIYE